LGLPNGFDVNTYENWASSCSRCNREKQAIVFDPSIQVQLQRARKRANKAREIASKIVSGRQISSAVNILHRANAANPLIN
jgi:hypothetical protein